MVPVVPPALRVGDPRRVSRLCRLATVPLFLLALLVVRWLPALRYARLLDRRETVAARLLSVLLFPAAGLALLRPVTARPAGGPQDVNRPEGRAMPIQCSSYDNDAEAHAEVERLLAAGTPGGHISVLTGRTTLDHRGDRVGAFAGVSGPIGAYAGATSSTADAMGDYAGAGTQRRGGYGDADRDLVATYPDGVRREHVASHRELEKRLIGAGLDAAAAAADVAALHAGRVLVVVSPA